MSEPRSNPASKQATKRYLDRESTFRGRYSREVFQSLYFSYKPILFKITFYLICGFLGRFFLLANANFIGFWADSYCTRWASDTSTCHSLPSIFTGFDDQSFLLLLIGVTAVGFLLTAFYRIGFSRLSAEAVSRFYDEVTLRTSRLPIQFFDTNPVGRIVTRFSSDYGNVFRLFGGPLAEFFAIVFDLICMLLLVSFASPLYLPVILVIGVANYGVYRLNRDRLRHERRELSAGRSPSIAHFAETTQGASTIRIFGRQATFLKRFSRLNDRFLDQRLRTSAAVLRFSMQMGALTAFMFLFTALGGYWMALQGWVSIGSLGVAFTFIALSGTSLQMFFEWFAQFEEAMTGVERMNDYLRRKIEPGAKLPAAREFPTEHRVYEASEESRLKATRLVQERSAAVTIEDLWFRYSPELPYVLKGLDFQIRPGEKIGIVGRSGSGKTSFVQALFHLYPLERGRILIDGSGPEVDLGVFRRAIALISQEPTLFRGTVRENLDLPGTTTDGRLLESIERVGLGEWLQAQPSGLDSPIEERGRNLSAGEKQLLCIARCLLQDAPVIVMDEATSSVDPQSEEILERATREFFADRTQIIIAHRLSTLIHCDRILWLHKGEIRMFDKPERILPVFQATTLA
jgi:ABC-type multidrug transport system fused ATPase/permease subunit